MGDESMSHGIWGHLPLLLRSNSKDSVEYILQALWRTRRTGLDTADRKIFRDILQLTTDSELDPLLVCLRILIRRSVYENVAKDEIQKLFPAEVLPELQRLLTLLLLKFQKEWREDMSKEPLRSGATLDLGERDVKFQVAKDSMEMMLKSMYCIGDQLSELDIYSSLSRISILCFSVVGYIFKCLKGIYPPGNGDLLDGFPILLGWISNTV